MPVVLGPLVDELRVVKTGLVPSDRVIISGIQMATPGTKVHTRPGRVLAAASVRPPGAIAASGEVTSASR